MKFFDPFASLGRDHCQRHRSGLDRDGDGHEQPKRPEKPIGDDHRVLLVEVENSGVHWMEPEDLTLGGAIAGLASKSGLRISSSHGSRLANVVLADGSVAELPTNISPELLRTVLTEDFNQLYKYVSREQIEGMRSDAYPYFWLRLPAWIASIITPA